MYYFLDLILCENGEVQVKKSRVKEENFENLEPRCDGEEAKVQSFCIQKEPFENSEEKYDSTQDFKQKWETRSGMSAKSPSITNDKSNNKQCAPHFRFSKW